MTKRNDFSTAYIFDEATSDEGMLKADAASFHAFNPNGVTELLPDSEDFSHKGIFLSGLCLLYSRHENCHARRLRDYAMRRKAFTWADLRYCVNGIKRDAERAKSAMAEMKEAHDKKEGEAA